MRTDLVLDALRMALTRRRAGANLELVHHSDAGSQYTSYAFTQVLDDHAVLASIGSVGDAYDNALPESFVDSFKTELVRDRVWQTRTQLELAIVEWVAWFNTIRLHEALGDRPPAEAEALYAARTVLTPSLDQLREEPTKPCLRGTQPGSRLARPLQLHPTPRQPRPPAAQLPPDQSAWELHLAARPTHHRRRVSCRHRSPAVRQRLRLVRARSFDFNRATGCTSAKNSPCAASLGWW